MRIRDVTTETRYVDGRKRKFMPYWEEKPELRVWDKQEKWRMERKEYSVIKLQCDI